MTRRCKILEIAAIANTWAEDVILASDEGIIGH